MSILGNVQVEHMKVEHKVEHSSSTGPTQVEHIDSTRSARRFSAAQHVPYLVLDLLSVGT